MAPADESGRYTVLYPLVALVSEWVGARAVGLVDVGRSAALNLQVDRVGISYGDGRNVGDAASPVQVEARTVGDRPVPERSMPPVVARIAVARTLFDLSSRADADRVRSGPTLSSSDRPPGPGDLPRPGPGAVRSDVTPWAERAARLGTEVSLAATAPPELVRGDPVESLPTALALVPGDALPVVVTTWALSAFSVPRRRRFLERLAEVAAERPVAWVSAEGVGVAPEVPTFGDRPASGHSILGAAVFDGGSSRVEAVGRCWSRGAILSWLA